jgi:hypothetical protein
VENLLSEFFIKDKHQMRNQVGHNVQQCVFTLALKHLINPSTFSKIINVQLPQKQHYKSLIKA